MDLRHLHATTISLSEAKALTDFDPASACSHCAAALVEQIAQSKGVEVSNHRVHNHEESRAWFGETDGTEWSLTLENEKLTFLVLEG